MSQSTVPVWYQVRILYLVPILAVSLSLAAPAWAVTYNFGTRSGRQAGDELTDPVRAEQSQSTSEAPHEPEPIISEPVPLPDPVPEVPAATNTSPETPVPVVAIPVPVAAPAPVVPTPETQVVPSPAPVAVEVPAAVPAPQEAVWLEDDLPEGATSEGEWLWVDQAVGGTKSHAHASAKGVQSHSLLLKEPISIPLAGMVIQHVWLDPQDPPKGLALRFKLASGEEVGVYWEGEEEVFRPSENEELWYYGMLPEFDKWTKLEILAEDLGLEEEKITGLRFVTFDGRVFWDHTALTQAPPIEDLGTPTDTAVELRPSLGETAPAS